MKQTYTSMLPLWHLQEKVALSDQYPSGLEWVESNGWHQAGEMAGKYNKHTGYYTVYLGGTPYVAHRLVYYLRTGKDPEGADVRHTRDNKDRDNRKELVLYVRKQPRLHKRPYVKSGLYTKTTCD
jgi:hypothetical protein